MQMYSREFVLSTAFSLPFGVRCGPVRESEAPAFSWAIWRSRPGTEGRVALRLPDSGGREMRWPTACAWGSGGRVRGGLTRFWPGQVVVVLSVLLAGCGSYSNDEAASSSSCEERVAELEAQVQELQSQVGNASDTSAPAGKLRPFPERRSSC